MWRDKIINIKGLKIIIMIILKEKILKGKKWEENQTNPATQSFLSSSVSGQFYRPIHSPAPFPLLSGGITRGGRQEGL